MTTSTRLDTMMAPWICGAGEGVSNLPGSLGAAGAVAGRWQGDGRMVTGRWQDGDRAVARWMYLSHAGMPDVGRVERQGPVAVDLLWG